MAFENIKRWFNYDDAESGVIHGCKRTITYYPFGFKIHLCLVCDVEMSKTVVSRVVNYKSPEAKYFDFSSDEGNMVGNINFIHDEYRCPNCGFQISATELHKIERKISRDKK